MAVTRGTDWGALLQRAVDTAAEVSDGVAQRLGAAADPRAKLLRKRRWARRTAWFLVVATVFWVGVTLLLAVWHVPAWALLIPSPIAIGASFLATLAFLRYRWLRRTPLPAARSARRLPPWGSVARAPLTTLTSGERALHELLGVLARAGTMPADEVGEIHAVAARTSATMTATAAEIVAMERAVRAAPGSRGHLEPAIGTRSAQLADGARQYDALVSAVARVVSAGARTPAPNTRYELGLATDRLAGWAAAIDELGGLRGA